MWTAIGGGGIGYEQQWYDVIASRAAGVTYVNSTGKPIFITGRAGASGSNFYVNGVHSGYVGSSAGFAFIVPVAKTYLLTNSITDWFELR